VALAPWHELTGAAADWEARISFEGRLHAATTGGRAAVTLAGQAVLADVRAAGDDGFRAERIALGIRRLQWPAADAVVDSMVLTRPAFALPVAAHWPHLLVTGSLSVVDGELLEHADGPALRQLELSLAPQAAGVAHLQLSASIEGGRRVGLDRLMRDESPEVAGVALRRLLAALEDVARAAE
jgi:hypothetical protein